MNKKQTYLIRRIKVHISYSIEEIASLLGLHEKTVRNWLTQGLPTIDQKRPLLIYGENLIEFLRKRQKSRKHPCQIDQFYCVKCKAPRTALGSLADLIFKNQKLLKLTALCAVCETKMNKIASSSSLHLLKKTFIFQEQVEEQLSDCSNASLNTHLQGIINEPISSTK